MRAHTWLAMAAAPIAAAVPAGESERAAADTPIDCSACEEWNRMREPFRVFGNTWYVGTAGLSSLLVTSGRALVGALAPRDHDSSGPINASMSGGTTIM